MKVSRSNTRCPRPASHNYCRYAATTMWPCSYHDLKGGIYELTQTPVHAFLSRVFLDPHNGSWGFGHRGFRRRRHGNSYSQWWNLDRVKYLQCRAYCNPEWPRSDPNLYVAYNSD